MMEPDIYTGGLNTSQRKVGSIENDGADWKYFDMIRAWGGWELFQELLVVLKGIATSRGVDVSNVAARWVLERPETGVVIVGEPSGNLAWPSTLTHSRLSARRDISHSLDIEDPGLQLHQAGFGRNRAGDRKEPGEGDVRANRGLRQRVSMRYVHPSTTSERSFCSLAHDSHTSS